MHFGSRASAASRSKSYQLSRKQTRTDSDDNPERIASAVRDTDTPGFKSSVLSSRVAAEDDEFNIFLNQHINLALTKGFDDNVGRNPVQAVFEVQSIRKF